MPCFLTQTASFLPGEAVGNERIGRFLGVVDGEDSVRDRVLALNGIRTRHYALKAGPEQRETHDLYELAAKPVSDLLNVPGPRPTFLSAGTTYAPLAAPGVASILHSRLGSQKKLSHSVEISSHSGVCTSSAQAFVAAIRAVESGRHAAAISVGAEQASVSIKSTAIRPVDDRAEHADVRRSQWFMCVFLRFMLSDGAGAVLLTDRPAEDGMSWRVEWTESESFAHERPLCMQVDSRTARLTQDPVVLSKHLFPAAERALGNALERHGERLNDHNLILPHISSFYFRRRTERMFAKFSCGEPPPYWTNLATAGNTGAASLYVLLDHALRGRPSQRPGETADWLPPRPNPGDRWLLLVPESGQFNFVVISLRAVGP